MTARTAQKDQLSNLGEFGLINQIKILTGKSSSVIKGIGDDTAVVPLSATQYLLLTADMLIEGVHFTKKMSAKAIGHKVIGASISDIAAMGGASQYAVISLGVPKSCSKQFITALYQGMHQTAKKYKIHIVGGDTVKSNKIIINVTLVGIVNKKHVVYRDGASKGDQVFVTGPLGQSLSSGWHLRFIPRVQEAEFLVSQYKPSAMIDISDGLAADLGHILEQSKVGAVLDQENIPCRRKASIEQALYDGEDFELLFTLPLAKARKLEKLKQKKFMFRRIGEIINTPKSLRLRMGNGTTKAIPTKGYKHF